MQLSLNLEPSESKTASTKTGVLHDIATQGHSRSFILQSVTGRQVVAYRHIILLALGPISEVSEEVATEIAKNCSRRQPHSNLRPRKEEPPRMCACSLELYFQKLELLAYIFSLIVWVYLYSNLCSELQKTHLFCTTVPIGIGRSRSFKVIQGE